MTIFNDLCVSFNNQADKDNLLFVFLCRTSLPEVNPLWAVRGFVFSPSLLQDFCTILTIKLPGFLKTILFIYFWPQWVFLLRGLSLIVVAFSGGAWMGFSRRWSTGPRAHGLSSCGRQALVPGLRACNTRA